MSVGDIKFTTQTHDKFVENILFVRHEDELPRLVIPEFNTKTRFVSEQKYEETLALLRSTELKLAKLQKDFAELALTPPSPPTPQRLSATWEHLPDVITPFTAVPQPTTTPSGKPLIPFNALRPRKQPIGLVTEYS
jgi:hypothetical protein